MAYKVLNNILVKDAASNSLASLKTDLLVLVSLLTISTNKSVFKDDRPDDDMSFTEILFKTLYAI